LIDAQRLLPIFLFLMYLLPLLWGGDGDDPIGGGVRGFVHVFGVWFGAIVVSGLMTRSLMQTETREDASRDFGDSPPERATNQGTGDA
jgi:hypothetical protein